MLLEIPNKTDEFIISYYLRDIFICPTLVSRPLRRFGFSSWVPVYFLLAIPTFLASTAVGRVHRSPENKTTEGGMLRILLKREREIETRGKKTENWKWSYWYSLLHSRSLRRHAVGGDERCVTTQRTDVKQTIIDRARVQVKFCPHFSFFRSPCSLTAPRSLS